MYIYICENLILSSTFFFFFFLFNPHLRTCVERRRERNIHVKEKHQSVCLLHTPWVETEPATSWPFCLWDDAQPTEPYKPGLIYFLKHVYQLFKSVCLITTLSGLPVRWFLLSVFLFPFAFVSWYAWWFFKLNVGHYKWRTMEALFVFSIWLAGRVLE